MPTHHDEVAAGRFDTPMEPLFLRMRDELPRVHPISPLYREPICFDTQTKAVFIGESARRSHAPPHMDRMPQPRGG
jgi:hypothetical protein